MDNLDVLIAQYKNIDDKLNTISDRLVDIGTDTAINKNDILSLKEDVASLKMKQATLSKELNDLNLKLRDTANIVPLEKSKKWDGLLSLIVKNIVPYVITLIAGGAIVKLGGK